MKQKIILEVTEKKVKLRWWKNDRLKCWTGKNPGVNFEASMPYLEGNATIFPKMEFDKAGHFECNFYDVKCTEYKQPSRGSRP